MEDAVYQKIISATTRELDQMLLYATAEENYRSHEDMIKMILRVLWEREKNAEPEMRESEG